MRGELAPPGPPGASALGGVETGGAFKPARVVEVAGVVRVVEMVGVVGVIDAVGVVDVVGLVDVVAGGVVEVDAPLAPPPS